MKYRKWKGVEENVKMVIKFWCVIVNFSGGFLFSVKTFTNWIFCCELCSLEKEQQAAEKWQQFTKIIKKTNLKISASSKKGKKIKKKCRLWNGTLTEQQKKNKMAVVTCPVLGRKLALTLMAVKKLQRWYCQ